MFCPKCKKRYNPKDSFCKKCGTELKSNVKGTYNRKGFSLTTFKATIIFMIVFSIFILIILLMPVKNAQNSNSSLPVFSVAALDVASKFYCPCGSCKKSLDKCTCESTIKLSREIKSELSKGKTQIQVISEFQIKYKSIKPEFRYLIE